MKCPKCGGDELNSILVGYGAGRWVKDCWDCDYNSDTFDSTSPEGLDHMRKALDNAGIKQPSSSEWRDDNPQSGKIGA